MAHKDKELKNKTQREFRGRNRKSLNTWTRNYYRQRRIDTIGAMGGSCFQCGFADRRALQIDHVNGGGTQERKKLSYMQQHKRALEFPEEYQLLCANCNWIKKTENNENRTVVEPYD